MSQIREYEVTVLIEPNQDTDAVAKYVEDLTATLTHGEGEDAKPVYHAWGKRQLAYEIKRNKDAHYLHFEAKLDGKQIRGIEREMQFDENILRYMFVKKEIAKNEPAE